MGQSEWDVSVSYGPVPDWDLPFETLLVGTVGRDTDGQGTLMGPGKMKSRHLTWVFGNENAAKDAAERLRVEAIDFAGKEGVTLETTEVPPRDPDEPPMFMGARCTAACGWWIPAPEKFGEEREAFGLNWTPGDDNPQGRQCPECSALVLCTYTRDKALFLELLHVRDF